MSRPRVRFTALQLMLGVAAVALACYFYTSIRSLEASIFLFRQAPRWRAEVAEMRAIGAHDLAEQRLIGARDDDRLARECLWRAAPALVLVGACVLYASTFLASRLIPGLGSRFRHERPGMVARAGWSGVAVILAALVMSSVARIAAVWYPRSPRPVMVIKDGHLIEAGQANMPVTVPDDPETLYLEPITAPSTSPSDPAQPR
jgi:hypothetical protein